jgi:A/G-specific adenine glycosylase
MLQQTQASRVEPFYRAFIGRFPSVQALAQATPGSVLRAWQGLGYNMRALRLHATAVFVCRQRRGAFPSTVEGLSQLPGVGAYTARAVAAFAFGRKEAVLDTNVRRVLRRWYPRSTDLTDFQALADRTLARYATYDWNQAIMELGATVCTPAEPKCQVCPVAIHCPSAGKAARVYSGKKVREQSYRGQPRRIYRGRVLKLLHARRRGVRLSESEIARLLFVTPKRDDRRFVKTLIATLGKDGLVSLKQRGARWTVSRVR